MSITDPPAGRVVSGGVYAQTLSRGLVVLEVLAQAHGPLSANQLQDLVGVNRSVMYRLLRTLEAHGLIADGEGGYELGLGIVSLARSVARDLRSAAQPILASLAEAAGATAVLSIVDGAEVVTLLQVNPRTGPHVRFGEGLRQELGLGSPGVALLAARPATSAERPDIAAARVAGYSRSEGEIAAGTVGISAAVAGLDAAISVVFLSNHPFPEAKVAADVQAAASDLARTVP